jgi:DNA-directed RNA polymerase subunit RPC12/RpoP
VAGPVTTPPEPTGPTCPECGSRAITPNMMSTRTSMLYDAFWDDDGRWHSHDPNSSERGLRCRGCGHVWAEKTYATCWCGWSGERRG